MMDTYTRALLARQWRTEADDCEEWWRFSTEEGPTAAKLRDHYMQTGTLWPACQYCQIRHVCADGPFPCYQRACPECFWLWECLHGECDHAEDDTVCLEDQRRWREVAS